MVCGTSKSVGASVNTFDPMRREALPVVIKEVKVCVTLVRFLRLHRRHLEMQIHRMQLQFRWSQRCCHMWRGVP